MKNSSKQPVTANPTKAHKKNLKPALHPRNRHQGVYDFSALCQAEPALASFVSDNAYGNSSIDFANPQAVQCLNRALLKAYYGIVDWHLPAQNLCPPIPGRADYIHSLADLISASGMQQQQLLSPSTSSKHKKTIPRQNLSVLDIGTGASCIYPLIGHAEYGWEFTACDINPLSLTNAESILQANPEFSKAIQLRLQSNPNALFKGIIQDDEWFDLTMCNPPFHTSMEQAREGSQRKWENLKPSTQNNAEATLLNFGGHDAELFCEGGEAGFISRMIRESAHIPGRCFWFTTLVSKSSTLDVLYAELKRCKVQQQHTITMQQGQKQSRLLAWTFLTPAQQAAWRKIRWNC